MSPSRSTISYAQRRISKWQIPFLVRGVSKLFHARTPSPVAMQPTSRMNRDTLHSMAVIDITEGAPVTPPETGSRYISAHIVDQDHHMKVFSGGGTYAQDMDQFKMPYVVVIVRTMVDAADPEDVAKVNASQDQIKIEAPAVNSF